MKQKASAKTPRKSNENGKKKEETKNKFLASLRLGAGSSGLRIPMHYVHGKQVAVIGLGRSGFAAARLLSVHGAHVVVLDDKTPEKLAGWIEKTREMTHVKLLLGGIDPSAVLSSD